MRLNNSQHRSEREHWKNSAILITWSYALFCLGICRISAGYSSNNRSQETGSTHTEGHQTATAYDSAKKVANYEAAVQETRAAITLISSISVRLLFDLSS
jgi:hypothetical protein